MRTYRFVHRSDLACSRGVFNCKHLSTISYAHVEASSEDEAWRIACESLAMSDLCTDRTHYEQKWTARYDKRNA